MADLALPDFDSIREVIETSKDRKDRSYATNFGEFFKTDPSQNWPLLQQIFDFNFKPSDIVSPFGPMLVMDGKRSLIPDDLTDVQLSELQATLEKVEDPEYQARIADIMWLRRRDPKAARTAVESYLKSGIRLEDPQHWPPSMDRYERAARLALQIEPRGNLPKAVLKHLEERVKHYNGSDPSHFTLKALQLLVEFRSGDFAALAEIAGRIGAKSRSQKNYVRARNHLDVQGSLLKLAKDFRGSEAALVSSAECFGEEAEARETKKEFIAAHSLWGAAINAFRERPTLRPRASELQKRYSAAGVKTRDEMTSIGGGEIDLTEFVKASRAKVAGLTWPDAFFSFVTFVPLIDPTELREAVEKEIQEHPIQAMVSADIFDASGRKIGVRPSTFTDDPIQLESAIAGFMEQNAAIHRNLTVHAHLLPAMRQILEEHSPDETAISSVLGDSRFVPEERRQWFLDAFAAGFRWEFSNSLHVLIPQIENALRYVLSKNGETPTNVDADGIEEVWGLEKILNCPTTTTIFGARFIYELKSLLVERLGSNLRNLFAHGLLSPNDLQGETALYLWWVFLRMAAFPTSGMKAFVERERKKIQPE